MKTYNKLVRDKTPNIIKANGGECKFHVANNDEYEILLFAKLREKMDELYLNFCAEEIADVLEVIEVIARRKGITLDEIKSEKTNKRESRGGFRKKIVLEIATEKND